MLPMNATIKTERNPAFIQLEKSHRILLLQGPVGAFFDRLTRWLQVHEKQVYRIAFQGGDLYDSKILNPEIYGGTLQDWSAYFQDTLQRLQIDCLVLFGQSRKYHEIATKYAKQIGLPVVVLEEGYFRPGFITMELGGVNGYSTTMQSYAWCGHTSGIEPNAAKWHFQSMALQASMHYIAMRRRANEFTNYQHHRNSSPSYYALYWLRSWWRKLKKIKKDLRFQNHLFKSSQPYFFVPLQHDGDAQITHHSPFGQNANFISAVLRSFALHSAAGTWLVFRQHPHSRGGSGQTELIFDLADELRIRNRVHCLSEGDTPDLAERSIGVVLINSTVGLQAIERGAPLMVMGDALYKKDGLAFPGALDDFWRQAVAPDKKVALDFLKQIKNLTQAPASVYASFDHPLQWTHSPS